MPTETTDAASRASRPGASLRRRCLGALIGAALSVASAEAALRLAVRGDDAKGRTLFGVALMPYAKPPRRDGPDDLGQGYIAYDARCGWAPRPFGTDGTYFADQHGLRAASAAERRLDDSLVRVVLFGDSFAHSDEVAYEDSLAVAMERTLPGAQVLSAGVPAYGTDLAYLRYLALREVVRPDVVVIAVHPNDFLRNVALWTSSGFTKPRFVEEGGGLVIVNQPPVHGDAFQRVFDDFDAWDLACRQTMYVAGSYDERPADASMLLRFVRSVAGRREGDARYRRTTTKGADDEVHRVSAGIVALFARDAAAAGARPVVVVLPSNSHVEDLRRDNDWWTATLRRGAAATGAPLADVTPALLAAIDGREVRTDAMFTRGGVGHFTAAGNAFAAARLRETLQREVDAVRARRR